MGNSNLFAYDSRDNCVSATDANGNETVYAYDGLSRPMSSTSYQGATTTIVSSSQVAYDDNDRCTSSTDANGNVTLHAYDSLDRPTQTTQADGTPHTFVWNYRSDLIQETDANGTVILHAYDLNDRCISNNVTPGAGVATTTTFETFAYDGTSRLVAATNDVSHSEIEYDSLGDVPDNHHDGWNVLSAYDSVGRRTSLTYPGGRVLTYAYDALDQCTNIVESSASLASFSYDGQGRVARVSYANGMRTRIFYDGISGVPNASGDFGHGQVSRILHAMSGGSPQISEVRLAWDRNGNKTKRDDAIFPPAIPRTNAMTLTYDAADRLTRATVLSNAVPGRDTIYGLDRMGNRTNVTGAASCSGDYFLDGLVPGPLDFQMNQYTTTPCDARSYDDNGNLVSRSAGPGSSLSYTHDYAGRLVSVSDSGNPVANYAYDALGRRIAKTVFSGGLPPVTTQFIYDGDDVIETRQSGALIDSFIHRVSDRYLLGLRHAGQNYFVHADDQGNALALTDSAGVVVERYDYDDYGAVTFLTSDGTPTSATSSQVGNVYLFGGLRLDAETGLQNDDGGGYLETATGRYLLRAGVPLRFDTSAATYAGNNPWSGGGEPLGYALNAHVAICQHVMDGAMKKGTVKFFNEAKGFGFMAGGGEIWVVLGAGGPPGFQGYVIKPGASQGPSAAGEPENSINDVNR